jgi:hypothetical protein
LFWCDLKYVIRLEVSKCHINHQLNRSRNIGDQSAQRATPASPSIKRPHGESEAEIRPHETPRHIKSPAWAIKL